MRGINPIPAFLMFKLDKLAEEMPTSIKMTLGKCELPLHKEIKGAMINAITDEEKRNKVYPSGLPELKNALAKYYKCSENQIVISTGTSAIFRNIYQILLNENNGEGINVEVLLPRPYYPLYLVCAKIIPNVIVKYYDIDLKTSKIQWDTFNITDRTKIVVINSPGNPLGNIVSQEDVMKMDEIINKHRNGVSPFLGATIISDEIYSNMYFDENKKYSIIDITNIKSPFIITNSFSKGYRMYTSRVGWCITNNLDLVKKLTIMQEHTLLTTDPVMQYGGIEALKHQEEVEYVRKLYRKKFAYAKEKLGDRIHESEGGFYFMISHEGKNGDEIACDILEKVGVAVVPGEDFGIPNYLRISFTTEKFEEGIDRLTEYFKKFL